MTLVLIATFIYNFLCLLLVFIIKDYSAVYSSLLINIRSMIYLFQDKLKKKKISHLIPISIVICHIIIRIVSIEHWYQIFTLIAPIILTLSLWYENKRQRMRIEQSVSDALLLGYNACVGLYLLCGIRAFMIVLSIIAIIKNKNNKNED